MPLPIPAHYRRVIEEHARHLHNADIAVIYSMLRTNYGTLDALTYDVLGVCVRSAWSDYTTADPETRKLLDRDANLYR